MRHYELQSSSPCGGDMLVFDWDIERGVVVGPGAKQIIDLAADGQISCQPMWHTFSSNPFKNKTDMAAIVGLMHHVPDDLAPFFPVMEDDGIPDVTYVDEDGVTVIGRDQICY